MDTVHLDEIIEWIDRAFDAESIAAEPDTEQGERTLERILGSDSYQRYLRDQINRQIIRDYLTNAVVLGVISEGGLAAFAGQIASEEGRSTLALYMLMSAIEDAADLPPVAGEVEPLKPLNPSPEDDRSHIKLVPR